MGGLGSGEWQRWNTKETTEGWNRIDIFYLKREGFLNSRSSGTLSWSIYGKETGSIVFRIARGRMILTYTYRNNGNEWVNIEDMISITTTSCNYGGYRKWFLCPGCGRRVAILYGGKYFRCRICQELTYSSQQETPPFRLLRKAQKIRKLLGASTDTDDPIIDKPKGMHQAKFDRLRHEAYQAARQSWKAMAREVGMDTIKQFGMERYFE